MNENCFIQLRHEPDVVQKLWGYEKIFVNQTSMADGYCGKVITVLPNGQASSIHYHRKKRETFYVLMGSLIMELYALSDERHELKGRFLLKPGVSLTITPFTPHRFWTYETVAEFVEVSTPDDPEDSIRLVVSGPIEPDLKAKPAWMD